MARVKIFDTSTRKWVYADKSFSKIPIKGVDYFTEDDKAELERFIADELAKRGQLEPAYANSIKDCTDTTKLYVLPDGYIYAYTQDGGYTNLVHAAGYQDSTYLNYSTYEATARSGFVTTGFIPFTYTDVLRMSGVTWAKAEQCCIAFYDVNKKPLSNYIGNGYVNPAAAALTSEGIGTLCLGAKTDQSVTTENGVATFHMTFVDKDTTNLESGGTHGRAGYHVKYVRISAQGSGADMVVTVNEEIYGNEPSGYAWRNTNHAFVPAVYANIMQAKQEFGIEQHIGEEVIGDIAAWIHSK